MNIRVIPSNAELSFLSATETILKYNRIIYSIRGHLLFIDFQKAYDSIIRKSLYDILIKFGVPKKLVRFIKKLHNEELHSLYCSTNIFRVIKSRRLRWAGNVARMGGGGRNGFKILTGKPTRIFHKF